MVFGISRLGQPRKIVWRLDGLNTLQSLVDLCDSGIFLLQYNTSIGQSEIIALG